MNRTRQSFSLALRFSALICASLIGLLAAGCARFGTGGPLSHDPDRLARQVVAAMGGAGAFDDLRFLVWDHDLYQGDRRLAHRVNVWDRQTGAFRLETRDGRTLYTALLNLKTRQGRAFRNNQPMPPTAEVEYVAKALGWAEHDAFWLTSLAQATAPGATRSFAGDPQVNGATDPTLQVSFTAQAEAAPAGTRAWFYIDPATRRPAAWAVAEAGQDQPGPVWLWTRWEPVGEFQFNTQFEQLGGDQKIVLNNLHAPGDAAPTLFTRP